METDKADTFPNCSDVLVNDVVSFASSGFCALLYLVPLPQAG